MINRRRFQWTAAASAAAVPISNAYAATYDLVIKGGRVIDPSLGIDAISDVAIAAGRIAAVGPDINVESGTETINASGKIVAPGLIDILTHAARKKEDSPLLLLDGV